MSGANRSGPRAVAWGFTLIELLTVMVVIAGLIALTLPAVEGARQAAKTTACLSNQRQIGVVLNAYLVDSRGVLPTLFNRESSSQPRPALDTELNRDSAAGRIYRCPADDAGLFEATGSSYLWNFTVNGQHIDDLFSIIGGDEASRVPLVSDKEGFHRELPDRVVVLYADGRAERALRFSLTGDEP